MKKNDMNKVKIIPQKRLYKAKVLMNLGAYTEAEIILCKVLKTKTSSDEVIYILCDLYIKQNEFEKALILLEKLFKVKCNHLVLLKIIQIYRNICDYESLVSTYERLAQCVPKQKFERKYMLNYARALSNCGQYEKSIGIYEQHSKLSKSYNGHYIEALKSIGKYDKAIILLKTIIKDDPTLGYAYWSLSHIKTYKFTQSEFQNMLKMVNDVSYKASSVYYLYLAIGKAYEDMKEYEKAILFYKRSKDIQYSKIDYNSDLVEIEYSKYRKYFDKFYFSQIFENYRQSKNGSIVTPIFIVGMHRSGSTLLEQILSTHSKVDGTKELPFIPIIKGFINRAHADIGTKSVSLPEAITTLSSQELSRMGDKYIRYTEIYRTGKPYFTDKLPGNFKNIGLIFSILPNALVIDIRRNPIAVGMANLRELFSTSITHVKNPHTINHYNKQYTELMEHWGRAMPNKILTINYEDLVEKTELNVKNLLEFCKLPFEDECLKFYTNKRVVKTPSASQVRQPIYTDSLYNWENFERFLPELNC